MRYHTRESAGGIRVGDMLNPDPLWNQTERPQHRLAAPTRVLGVSQQRICETGVMLKVREVGGGERWLSAGWFLQNEEAVTRLLDADEPDEG